MGDCWRASHDDQWYAVLNPSEQPIYMGGTVYIRRRRYILRDKRGKKVLEFKVGDIVVHDGIWHSGLTVCRVVDQYDTYDQCSNHVVCLVVKEDRHQRGFNAVNFRHATPSEIAAYT